MENVSDTAAVAMKTVGSCGDERPRPRCDEHLSLSREAVTAASLRSHNDVQRIADMLSRLLREEPPPPFRKGIDVAFNMALAGHSGGELFSTLCKQAEAELRRTRWRRAGWKKPRSAHTLVQVAERAAAAGCRPGCAGGCCAGLFDIIAELLEEDELGTYAEAAAALRRGSLDDLQSPRVAVWLHRTSCRDRKVWASAARLGEFECPAFADPSLPLCVDLGCGYGVKQLAAASRASSASGGSGAGIASGGSGAGSSNSSAPDRARNFLGVDLSAKAVGYARGVARRWRLSDICAFVEADARQALRALRERYAGPVDRIDLCCPTPFRAGGGDNDGHDGHDGGSLTQLPASASSLDFLGCAPLLAEAAATLRPNGRLVISST